MQTTVSHAPTVGAESPREFATTHWSVVLAAGDSQTPESAEALQTLCRAYWPPLYAYVRRQGHPPEEAQDLTQEFFLRLLSKHLVKHAHPEYGKFRAFLLTSLKHFLVSGWRKTERKKRGGGQVFVSWDASAAEQCYMAGSPGDLTSEELYEKRWATTLMERVLARLRDEYRAADKEGLFERLKCCLWGDESARPYAEIATELGLTEGAVKADVHGLRRRCRAVLRGEIAQTVARPEDIEDELRHLIEALSG